MKEVTYTCNLNTGNWNNGIAITAGVATAPVPVLGKPIPLINTNFNGIPVTAGADLGPGNSGLAATVTCTLSDAAVISSTKRVLFLITGINEYKEIVSETLAFADTERRATSINCYDSVLSIVPIDLSGLAAPSNTSFFAFAEAALSGFPRIVTQPFMVDTFNKDLQISIQILGKATEFPTVLDTTAYPKGVFYISSSVASPMSFLPQGASGEQPKYSNVDVYGNSIWYNQSLDSFSVATTPVFLGVNPYTVISQQSIGALRVTLNLTTNAAQEPFTIVIRQQGANY